MPNWNDGPKLNLNGLTEFKQKLDETFETIENVNRLYALAVDETAEGDIASFSDGSDGLPVKKLEVAVTPAQDLHGYDNPWPAGGGKNLWKPYNYTATSINGVDITYKDDGSVTLNGTADGTIARPTISEATTNGYTCTLPAGTYKPSISGSTNNISYEVYKTSGATRISSNGESFTLTETTEICFRVGIISGSTYNNQKAYLQIESGTTASSFEPYSNICPITGWTGANVTRTGKNLGNFVDGYNIWTDGEVTEFSGRSATITPVKIESGKSYVYTSETSGVVLIYAVWNGNTMVRRETGIPSGTTLNTSGGDRFVACIYKSDYSTSVATDKPMIRFSTESNDYEPYRGITIPITFPSSAGTVYGGTLDVTSGKLTVDRATVTDFSSLSNNPAQSTDGTYRFQIYAPNVFSGVSTKCISSFAQYRRDFNYGGIRFFPYTNNFIYIMLQTSNRSEALNILNGQMIVYELAAPVEYTLTPTQVTTLLGTNNIWADTGDVSVDYRADIKMYIDQAIATAIAAL